MNIRKLAAFSGSAMLTLGAAGMVSAASVAPIAHDGNITAGGNFAVTCPEGSGALGIDGSADSGTAHGTTVYITYREDNSIHFWTVGGKVSVAYVKGGNGYNEYRYSPSVTTDSDLVSPLNGGENVPAVSHTVWCVTGDKVEPSEEPSQSVDPSEEPSQSVDPSEEPSQSVEPSEEPSQSVEPSEEPSQSVEPSEEPSEEPSNPPEESEEPTSTPSEGVKGETDVPTAPPTDVLGSSSTTQTGGALPILLIVLGVISLGAVVVTPARNRR